MTQTLAIPSLTHPEASFFSEEGYYKARKCIPSDIEVRAKYLEQRAFNAIQKKYAGGILSPSERVVFSALLRLWIGASNQSKISISTCGEAHDIPLVTIQPYIYFQELPISRDGFRFVTEALVLGCRDSEASAPTFIPANETHLRPQYTFRYRLLGGGILNLHTDTLPEEGTDPITPSGIWMSPPVQPFEC